MVVMVAQETCKHPTLKIGESVNFVMYVYHNLKIKGGGTSLVVQWLRPCIPNTGGPGSITGWGTRPHMSQLTVCMPHLKSLPAAKEIQHS